MQHEIIAVPALRDNYIWLIKNQDHIVIVDPGDAKPVLDYINRHRLIPVAILITHHHYDHTNGIEAITKHYDIPVYIPKNEAVHGGTHRVSEGIHISLDRLELELEVLDVPGHTLGAIAYYNQNFVLSGDTLFSAGCGRIFEGTAEQMYESLNKFKMLDSNTLLYCGHEYTLANLKFARTIEPDNKDIETRIIDAEQKSRNRIPTLPVSLAIEKQTNPFLRCEQTHIWQKLQDDYGKIATTVEVFSAIRQLKDNFKA